MVFHGSGASESILVSSSLKENLIFSLLFVTPSVWAGVWDRGGAQGQN